MDFIQSRKRMSKKKNIGKKEKTPEEDVMKICDFCGIRYKAPSNLMSSGDEVCAICFKRHITEPTWVSYQNLYDIKKEFDIEVKCKYEQCNYYAQPDKIQDHQKICEKFLLVCLIYSCGWEGRPRKYFAHFRSTHNEHMKMDRPDHKIISINEVTSMGFLKTHVEEIFGQLFVVELLIDHGEEVVRYIATNLTLFDPDKYKLVVEFEGKEGKYIASLNFFYTNNENKEEGYSFLDTNIRYDLISEEFTIHVAKKY